jgi:hypothetical protein
MACRASFWRLSWDIPISILRTVFLVQTLDKGERSEDKQKLTHEIRRAVLTGNERR